MGTIGDIDWNLIRNETEMLYSIWTSMVLDLYDIGVESDKIVGFSNSLDDALISIKKEEKMASTLKIAKLYGYITEFANKTEIEEMKKKAFETKRHIVNSYAYVETGKWDKVSEEVQNSEEKFSEILNNIDKENEQKKFNINKIYIMIQELKSSLWTEEKEIYHLKYKNLIEGLQCLM